MKEKRKSRERREERVEEAKGEEEYEGECLSLVTFKSCSLTYSNPVSTLDSALSVSLCLSPPSLFFFICLALSPSLYLSLSPPSLFFSLSVFLSHPLSFSLSRSHLLSAFGEEARWGGGWGRWKTGAERKHVNIFMRYGGAGLVCVVWRCRV